MKNDRLLSLLAVAAALLAGVVELAALQAWRLRDRLAGRPLPRG